MEAKLRGVDSDLKKLERISKSLNVPQWYIATKNFIEKDRFAPALEI